MSFSTKVKLINERLIGFSLTIIRLRSNSAYDPARLSLYTGHPFEAKETVDEKKKVRSSLVDN